MTTNRRILLITKSFHSMRDNDRSRLSTRQVMMKISMRNWHRWQAWCTETWWFPCITAGIMTPLLMNVASATSMAAGKSSRNTVRVSQVFISWSTQRRTSRTLSRWCKMQQRNKGRGAHHPSRQAGMLWTWFHRRPTQWQCLTSWVITKRRKLH